MESCFWEVEKQEELDGLCLEQHLSICIDPLPKGVEGAQWVYIVPRRKIALSPDMTCNWSGFYGNSRHPGAEKGWHGSLPLSCHSFSVASKDPRLSLSKP